MDEERVHMDEQQDEQQDALQNLIARCWDDEEFKERLVADPASVLAEEGVLLPEGITVHVAVDTETERTLVIPAPPGRLSDGDLERFAVSAGNCPTENCPTQKDWDPCYVNRTG
jgi:hypothetical protein